METAGRCLMAGFFERGIFIFSEHDADVFLKMQDLRSQLQEMIPEQQVCGSLVHSLVKLESIRGI